MSDKLGLYVCRGCGLGDCLDTARLEALGAEAAVVRGSAAFCLEDAGLIREDVAAGRIDAAVIAACSPRVKTDVFDFPGTFVERVNLREQVAWSHPPGEETQSLAEDMVRMGLVRARKASVPAAAPQPGTPTVLVVGGGATGIAAALAAAGNGYDVILVEKTERLGGYAARLHRQLPQTPPYRDPQPPGIDAAIQELGALANVRIHLSTEVTSIAGEPGKFRVSLRSGESTTEAAAGAIVMATGWIPGEASSFAAYGLGRFPNVITTLELEAMAVAGRLARPSDGTPVKSAALLVCDNQGDQAHLPYGGNLASLVALKQALYLRQLQPDATVYLLYRNLQAPGQFEYFYKRVQREAGILFSQGEIAAVTEDAAGRIVIETADSVLGGPVRIAVDLAVISTDMRPAANPPEGPLHLRYLQGPDLPRNPAGFADSHFICFPYETRRTGIYSAGAARQPMDLAAAARDGAAAALKSLQCIRQSAESAAVHPRVGDLSHPEFFLQKCTSCGRCTQECPFGALELGEKSRPVLDTNRCRRCGICMGACPVQIISFSDYSVDMLSSMIKAVEIPEGDEEKPRILVFACENDAYPALDMAGLSRLQWPASVRVIPVRCLGSVNAILIADAVSRGFDGVALLGCRAGDNYQCHYIRGSELLGTRMQNIRETLDRLALESERVRVLEVAIADAGKIPALLDEFVAAIRRIGPNPMKGF